MSPTIAVYAARSIQSYLHFLGKSHFGNIYIYCKLIAYVARIVQTIREIFSITSSQHRTVWKRLKISIEAQPMKKLDYFSRDPQN